MYDPGKPRRVLCVFAKFTPCFATFDHARPFFRGTVAFMPPQGIMTIAAYLPESWEVRLIDENVAEVTEADLAWADVVMTSGMHVQRRRLNELATRAHAHGKVCVVGGPSVSACPEYYPDYDILHVGELGDATDRIIEHLGRTVQRPAQQLIFQTDARVDIDAFPIPAYHLVELRKYMVSNIQWSSGCPYKCEFCDIPELYGRKPRTKSPERLLRELDAILAASPMGGLYFVDDNLIGNRKAARELMDHLIAWQQKHGYPLRFAGEASINLAQDPELLAKMKEAYFTDMFFGIETPDPDTLVTIDKQHNNRMDLREAVRVINNYGIELYAGVIFGFDADGEDYADKVIRFIEETNIPMMAINVLYALPKTPLHRRLEAEGRLIPDQEARESNIVFKLPEEKVVEMWRQAVGHLYAPESLLSRYRYNIQHTYPNRKQLPLSRFGVSKDTLHTFASAMGRLMFGLGLASDYKRDFWKTALPLMATGQVDSLIYVGAMAHHFMRYRDDVLSGRVRASNFHHEGIREQAMERSWRDQYRSRISA